MPNYSGKIKDGALKVTRPDLLNKWIGKHDGEWFSLSLKIPHKDPDPKTAEQLGIYWGLFVPEITEQLTADGHTITISAFDKVTAERKYTDLDTHELLTALCNHVGENGTLMRMSDDDMTVTRMSIVLDNVVKFAVGSLHMNGDKLKSWREE
jgi:hypothetical protein